MSLFHPAVTTCPKCGTKAEVQRVGSVNADRRPDYRTAILDGSFQAANCGRCGERLRFPPHLTYLDVGRNCWIAVEPASLISRWETIESEVFEVFDRGFGRSAPPAAQELGRSVRPRLVFGWAALREKLRCQDLGLDDVILELLKMAVMRQVNAAPAADQTELRLMAGDGATLRLQWIESDSESALASLDVPREVYDEIGEYAEDWALARDKFSGVFLVDVGRLLIRASA